MDTSTDIQCDHVGRKEVRRSHLFARSWILQEVFAQIQTRGASILPSLFRHRGDIVACNVRTSIICRTGKRNVSKNIENKGEKGL